MPEKGKPRVAHWTQAEIRARIVMSFKNCGQPFASDGFQPQSDRLPVRSSCRAITQMESPCAASSAATMMRVRGFMSRGYSGLSDFYGDNARSCCLCISLARCSGVSVCHQVLYSSSCFAFSLCCSAFLPASTGTESCLDIGAQAVSENTKNRLPIRERIEHLIDRYK